jgi:hypothetical protein
VGDDLPVNLTPLSYESFRVVTMIYHFHPFNHSVLLRWMFISICLEIRHAKGFARQQGDDLWLSIKPDVVARRYAELIG